MAETTVKPKTPLSLGSWPAGAGNASDITVTFARPTAACTLGVTVLSGGMTVYVDYVPGGKVQVGMSDGVPSFTPLPAAGTIGNGSCGPTNFGGDCNTQPTGA